MCMTQLPVSEQLSEHLQMHFPSVALKKEAQCPICEEILDRHSIIFSHIVSVHGNGKNNVEDRQNKARGQSDNSVVAQSSTEHPMDQPISTEKDKSKLSEYPICNKLRCDLKDHIEIQDPPQLKCETCGKMFRFRKLLMFHHLRVHVKDKRFKCSKCQKSFVSKQELKNHLSSHSQQRPFPCIKCKAQFKTRNHLRRHMTIHDVLRRKCKICRRFVDNWEQHKRFHSGEETGFTCEICPKVYDSEMQLQKHLVTVHSKNSFACSICDLKYKRRGDLNFHMKNIHGVNKGKE